MSASRNADSITPASGEVHSSVPRSEPLTTSGVSRNYVHTPRERADDEQHAPGVKVGNDAAPEFSVQTLPAGTAPQSRTFERNNQNETPGQANNPNISKETWTSASDTIGGATSADVHTGYGHPGQGQTSSELHDSTAKGGRGLAGVGADQSDTVRARGEDIDFPKGTKGYSGQNRENIQGADERLPQSAESVASERRG